MTSNKRVTLQEANRHFAVELNNQVWDLLQKTKRTTSEDDLMVHAAHSSMYHWMEVGKPVNKLRGIWLLSRVYAALQNAPRALEYAKKCVDLIKQHPYLTFDIAYAYEAMGRALRVSNDPDKAYGYEQLAIDVGEEIKDDKDKALFFEDLYTKY